MHYHTMMIQTCEQVVLFLWSRQPCLSNRFQFFGYNKTFFLWLFVQCLGNLVGIDFTCRKVFAPGARVFRDIDSNGNNKMSNTIPVAKNNEPPSPVYKQRYLKYQSCHKINIYQIYLSPIVFSVTYVSTWVVDVYPFVAPRLTSGISWYFVIS
jgi:hypothetical protein